MIVLVAALCLVAVQAPPEKDRTYEFLPPPRPVDGDVVRIVAEDTDNLWATIYEGSTMLRGLKIGKRLSFDATQETLEAQRGRPVRSRWTFAKAVLAKNENERPLSFQGRPVLVTRKDDLTLFKYESGPFLSLEEMQAIRQPFLGLGEDGPEDFRDPVFADVFTPGRTLKVGEPWVIPIAQAVRLIGGPGRAWSVDEKTSKASASLASVEKRGNALYGKITTDIDMRMNALETLQFEKPIPMRVKIEYAGAIDGSRPDSLMTLKMEVKGVSPAKDALGRRLKVEFDSTAERTISRKYVTKE